MEPREAETLYDRLRVYERSYKVLLSCLNTDNE